MSVIIRVKKIISGMKDMYSKTLSNCSQYLSTLRVKHLFICVCLHHFSTGINIFNHIQSWETLEQCSYLLLFYQLHVVLLALMLALN